MIIDMSLWGWPQYVILSITAVNLIAEGLLHGRPVKREYNIGVRLFGTLISMTILIAGGFFS